MVEIFIAIVVFASLLVVLMFYISPKKTEIKGSRDILSFIPIQQIDEDGLIYGENAEITVGYRLELPEVFLLGEKNLENLHGDWVALMKSLPEGTKIQKQDFYFVNEYSESKEYSNIVEKKNYELYKGRPVLNSYSIIWITFIKNTVTKKGDIILQKRVSPMVGNLDDIEKRAEDVIKVAKSIEMRLGGLKGYRAKQMNGEEVTEEIFKYVTQSYDRSKCVNVKKIPDIALSKEGNLMIGDRLVSVISLMEEGGYLEPFMVPKTAAGENYSYGINYKNKINSSTGYAFAIHGGLPMKHCVNTVINLVGNEQMLEELRKEKTSLNFLATFYEPAKVKQKFIEGFSSEIVENALSASLLTVNVIVDDYSVDGLQEKVSHVQNAFLNMNQSLSYKENIEAAGVYFETIPGHARRMKREIKDTTVQAACYINNEGMYRSDLNGIIFNDRYGKPVVVDLWDNVNTTNRNKLIFGPSGSGKSYFINGLVSQTYTKGNHVIVLEIGRSLKRNCELLGGLYFDTADRDKLRFNIFSCDRDSQGRYIYRNLEDKEEQDDKVNYITTIITAIWKSNKEVSNLEREIVKKSVVGYYEYVNKKSEKNANIKGYYEYLDIFRKEITERERQIFDIEALKIMLEKYVNGVYSELLNGSEEINIDNDRFIVFEMEGVQNDPELFTVVSVIIVEMVLQKIKRLKGIKKSLVIDEALNFLQDSKMGEFIGYLYRTIRKKEGEIYIAAQNVKFLDGITPVVRDSIVLNSDTKILLDHSNHRSSYSDLRRILSLTESQIELLDSLVSESSFKEFLIVLGSKAGIFRMEVSKFADGIYTSKESESKEIERLLEETGSLTSAVEQYVENKSK